MLSINSIFFSLSNFISYFHTISDALSVPFLEYPLTAICIYCSPNKSPGLCCKIRGLTVIMGQIKCVGEISLHYDQFMSVFGLKYTTKCLHSLSDSQMQKHADTWLFNPPPLSLLNLRKALVRTGWDLEPDRL